MVVWISDAHHTVDQNCPFSTMRPVPYNEWAEIQRLQRWFPLCSANALCLVFIQQDEKVSFWIICLHVPLLDCVSLLVQCCQVRPDVFQWDMRVNSRQGASTRLSLWESEKAGPAVPQKSEQMDTVSLTCCLATTNINMLCCCHQLVKFLLWFSCCYIISCIGKI